MGREENKEENEMGGEGQKSMRSMEKRSDVGQEKSSKFKRRRKRRRNMKLEIQSLQVLRELCETFSANFPEISYNSTRNARNRLKRSIQLLESFHLVKLVYRSTRSHNFQERSKLTRARCKLV